MNFAGGGKVWTPLTPSRSFHAADIIHLQCFYEADPEATFHQLHRKCQVNFWLHNSSYFFKILKKRSYKSQCFAFLTLRLHKPKRFKSIPASSVKSCLINKIHIFFIIYFNSNLFIPNVMLQESFRFSNGCNYQALVKKNFDNRKLHVKIEIN